ncbi:MAG: hypothetical protein ACOCP8_10415 [archaeon]
MRGIGIRVNPNKVYFSITEKNDDLIEILNVSNLIVPKAPKTPFKLNFIRTNLFSIIQEFNIIFAGLRIAESNARTMSLERIYLEGVIQELLVNSNIENHFVGRIAEIASIINKERTDIRKCFEGENILNIREWENYNREERESICTSICSCNL